MTVEKPRKKIMFLSDHPLIPSGVGTQAKYLIEGLLKTEEYKFLCLGGAIKHPDYKPQMVAPELFGEGNWIIHPVDGHGSKDFVRKMLREEKPDAMVIFTDPRFFMWVWEMEDEIRRQCPLLYWHVWDNDPTPEFNRIFYDSTDFVVPLSLKTYGLLQDLGYDRMEYVPHAVPSDLFKPMPDDEVEAFKRRHYGPHAEKKFVVMWNNRNARRKAPGDVVESFSRFAHKVGKKNVALFMHTEPRDPEGQDVLAVGRKLGIDNEIIVSNERLDPAVINMFYNVADVTINIAQNEGFGLGTLESLMAGTPIVVHMTGGLQFQAGDWWSGFKNFRDQRKLTDWAERRWRSGAGDWWGVPVFPAVRNCVGSQQVPYIYDDRADNDDVAKALERMYDMGRTKRKALGLRAREWACENFDISKMISGWDSILSRTIEGHRAPAVRSTTI